MKTPLSSLGLAILICASLPSCQNSTTESSTSTTTDSSYVEVAEVIDYRSNLTEHLPDLIETTHAINTNSTSEIELESGVTISIPKNAFVDSEGKPVEGTVTIHIADMTSMAQVIHSGYAMHATAPDGESGSFQTAGMISIVADGDIQIANGKSLAVTLPNSNNDDYPLWKLDDSGNWKMVSSNTTINRQTTPITSSSSSTARIYQPLKTLGVIDITVDQVGTPMYSSTEVYRDIHLKFPAFYRAHYERVRPVQWQEYSANNPLNIRIDLSKAATFWEFADMRPLYFTAANQSELETSKRLNLRNLFMRKSTTGQYQVFSFNQYSLRDTVCVNVIPNYVPSQRQTASDRQNTIIKRWKCDSALIALGHYLISEVTEGANEQKWQSEYQKTQQYVSTLIGDEVVANTRQNVANWVLTQQKNVRPYLLSPGTFYAERGAQLEAARNLDSINDYTNRQAQRAQEVLSRSFNVSEFGVYNCDRFYRVPSDDFPILFVNQDNESVNISFVRLVDVSANAVVDLNLNPEMLQACKLGTNTEFKFVAIADDDMMYLGSFDTSKFDKTVVNTIVCRTPREGANTSQLFAAL